MRYFFNMGTEPTPLEDLSVSELEENLQIFEREVTYSQSYKQNIRILHKELKKRKRKELYRKYKRRGRTYIWRTINRLKAWFN